MTSISKQTRTKTRRPIEILKSIAFNVNLIVAVGGAVLAGAYYVSRKVTNCKAADAKEKPPAFASEARKLGTWSVEMLPRVWLYNSIS